jgi:TrmH family RNA methyltransferase
MISKARIKFIKSLQVKKYRKQEQCFIVEGAKSVKELLQSDFETIWVAGSEDFALSNQSALRASHAEVIVSNEKELSTLGLFQTNEAVLAVAKMKPNTLPELTHSEVVLVLDDIRDPGNLGTIIRTADWYGIHHIIASEDTADFYNPKVISSTMGSFCRTSVHYASLPAYLETKDRPVYGAFLDGEDIHRIKFQSGAMIVMGNESRGISPEVEKLIRHRVTIPRIGGAESLNAAIATGIFLDNLRRG